MVPNDATKERTARSSLQQFLKGADYPASKQDLINIARRNDAPREVLDVLQRMPHDRFGDPRDVMNGYGDVRQ